MGPITIPLHAAGVVTGPDEVHARMVPNPNGWHKASAIMYVEQPVNVGFSRGPHEPQDEIDIGRAMDGFLQQFMHVFESYHHKRIFLVGESYAGMYVPSSKFHKRRAMFIGTTTLDSEGLTQLTCLILHSGLLYSSTQQEGTPQGRAQHQSWWNWSWKRMGGCVDSRRERVSQFQMKRCSVLFCLCVVFDFCLCVQNRLVLVARDD